MGGSSKGSKCSVKICSNRAGGGDSKSVVRFFRFPHPREQERMFQWQLACGDENIMKKEPVALYTNNRICSSHFENSPTNRRLSKTAVPTLNLFQESCTDILGEHSYCSANSMDIASENSLDIARFEEVGRESRYVDASTQTDPHPVDICNQGTQTDDSTSWDCQTQTTADLTSNTPRKRKLRELVKKKSQTIKNVETKNARLEMSFEKSKEKGQEISKDNFEKACDEHLPQFMGNLAKVTSDLKNRKLKGRR